MSSKDNYSTLGTGCGCLLGIFVLIAGCMAAGNDDYTYDDPRTLPAPVEEQEPAKDAVSYTVISAKGGKVDGENCVIARVKVFNHGYAPIHLSTGFNFPNPFTLVNAAGQTVWSSTDSLDLEHDIPPGGQENGTINFCTPELDDGSRVTLYHDKKKWKVDIPKDKPEHIKRPRSSEKAGGGAGPGYTGPRCYAPGGRTWHPC